MAIYKVILNGQAFGQDIKNILYYRTGIGIDISGLTVGGTVEVANAVKETVWPFMRALLPLEYELQDITAYVYDQSSFNLLYQNPTTVGVQQNGLTDNANVGPAICAIIRLALEPTSIVFNGPKPPKRGYLAFGPLDANLINDNGELDLQVTTRVKWDALCLALSSNVESLLPPAVFFPIRVHQETVLGIFKIVSFADVRDASVKTQTSFRRSRVVEA